MPFWRLIFDLTSLPQARNIPFGKASHAHLPPTCIGCGPSSDTRPPRTMVDEWQTTKPPAAQRVHVKHELKSPWRFTHQILARFQLGSSLSPHPTVVYTRPLTSSPPQGWLATHRHKYTCSARDDVSTSPDLDVGARALGSQSRQWLIFICSRPRPRVPTGWEMPLCGR